MPTTRLLMLAVSLLFAAAGRTQRFGEQATGVLAHQFSQTEDWALRSLVLLSLGTEYHPVAAAPALLEGLRHKDDRLRAFALSTLRRTDAEQLRAMATSAMLDELIRDQAREKNDHFAAVVLEVLAKMVPDTEAKSARDWARWWSKTRREWQPPEWVEPERKEQAAEGTATREFIERALDLNAAGLDVAITIDSTGSMQRAIDAARDAVEDIVEVLQGIAPKFRLGLSHYRDFGDMADGAELLTPLSPKVDLVRERLSKLIAMGGGDAPERVEKGMEQAILPHMGWRAESNKVLVIIGDAPPHPDAQARAVQLARQAHENPADLRIDNRPVTGRRKAVRPFIVSAIAVGSAPKAAFEEIAAAGGGKCAVLNLGAARAGPRGGLPGGPGAGPAGPREDKTEDASREVVGHILTLAFGSRFQDQIEDFVTLYYEWRNAGFFGQ